MTDYSQLKALTSGAYDLQTLRIQAGNRLCAEFRRRLGQEPGHPEDELDADAKRVLRDLTIDHARLTDSLVHLPRVQSFKGGSVIGTYAELVLVDNYVQLLESETRAFKGLEKVLSTIPIWTEWLSDVSGVGPAMGAAILSGFDIHKARYPSSMWRYAGLDVARDGRGRGRYKEHLSDVTYIDKDGNEATRKSLGYNPWLKTKLVGVLSTCFMRAPKSPYRVLYDNYKHRLENHDKHKDKTPGHRHRMALRYMVKMFLVDLHREWRKIEGLPVPPTYHEGKLEHKHSA